MEDSEVLISVIVPAFNADRFIAEALDSVLGQIYPHWECIVVNDGSTDNTLAIIDEYVKKDSRFIGITIPNSGVSRARNIGIGAAKGSYIYPLDADDLLDRTHLEKAMTVFKQNPSVRLVYTAVLKFGAESGPVELGPFDYRALLRQNMMISTLYKKEDFIKVGGYRENMVNGLEDWDFWIALMEDFTAEQVVRIPEPLLFYRIRSGTRSDMLMKRQQFDKMTDNLILNNFHIYQRFYPGIFQRVIDYDFKQTMLKKTPVRLMVRILIGISTLKNSIGKALNPDYE